MDGSPDRRAQLGTLEGVFVPTTLTILGVILFTRTGWVVGQVGIGSAILVITASYAVSLATALSLTSIVTNVKVGAGGAFALLSRTLGIEPGGSIGLPLYLAQAFATVLYLFGLRAGWMRLFPEHPAWAVDLGTFGLVFALALISAKLAFRLQYLVLAVIGASILSVWAGLGSGAVEGQLMTDLRWFNDEGVGLAAAFGVFFPAVTGIMAGVNMSGELKTPRRSIKKGTLWAIGLTWVVYISAALVMALRIPDTTLRSSDTAMVDASAFGPLVLAGLIAATFSSALSTAVGAPRILEALAEHGILPGKKLLTWRSPWGEPVGAVGATAVLVGGGMLLRDLNTVAPLITLFFLLTYGAINLTLLVQQGLRMPRFRPTFRVPLVVPFVGTVGCVGGMIAVSPAFAAVAVVAVAVIYILMVRRAPQGPYGQVRAGMTVTAASWALARLSDLPGRQPWQAHVVMPIHRRPAVATLRALAGALARRGGSVTALVVPETRDDDGDIDQEDPLVEATRTTCEELQDAGVLVRMASLPDASPQEAASQAMTLADGALVPPNLLMLPWVDESTPWVASGAFQQIAHRVRGVKLGLWLVSVAVPDREPPWTRIRVWIRQPGFDLYGDPRGLPLVLLAAWRLHDAWGVPVSFTTAVSEDQRLEEDEEEEIREHLDAITDRARIPGATCEICRSQLRRAMADRQGELHIVVLEEPMEVDRLEELRDAAGGGLVVATLSGDAEAD